MIYIGHGSIRDLCADGPKMEKLLKFTENFDIFDQNPYGKLIFFLQFLLEISWISVVFPKVYTRQDYISFLQQIFRSRWGRFGVPLTTLLLIGK